LKIIIDTHIFLWALGDPDRISEKKRVELEALSNTIFVSAITIAELMIKSSIGKLAIEFDPNEMVAASGFELLDFTALDAVLLKTMPYHHRDPFDRMLIAQSMANKARLMTEDIKFELYDCKLL
jgi:PIN domain nuclease of toxin-antitoxin system